MNDIKVIEDAIEESQKKDAESSLKKEEYKADLE
jgi:hypothetical protein